MMVGWVSWWGRRGGKDVGVERHHLRGALRSVRELDKGADGRGLLGFHLVQGRFVDRVPATTTLRGASDLIGGTIGLEMRLRDC